MADARVVFDANTMTLTYHSVQAGVLTLDARGRREIDGQAANLDYATYDCPFLRSAWDSGVVHMSHEAEQMTLDFRSEPEEQLPQ